MLNLKHARPQTYINSIMLNLKHALSQAYLELDGISLTDTMLSNVKL